MSTIKTNEKMTQSEQKKAAREFAKRWAGRGYEKGEAQKFWLDLFSNVFDVRDFADFVQFEAQIKESYFSNSGNMKSGNLKGRAASNDPGSEKSPNAENLSRTKTNFIDVYIPSTRVMIEQKSSDKDLRAPIKQSDGTLLTPFQQAKRYIAGLPVSMHPRYVVTCNFKEFLVYDMERPNDEPEEVLLKNLDKELYRLQFIVSCKSEHIRREEEISLKAGALVGILYDSLYKEYINPDASSLRSLNILCVRIVFCLYAEDSELFETKTSFEDYIKRAGTANLRHALKELFKALDTPLNLRDKYDVQFKPFPYINGGLFKDENIEIPNFTEEIANIITEKCAPFNWSEISPTIFGAVFESTLNPETRRSGGMHYTSIENIHKVIDPLFLDSLKEELDSIRRIGQYKKRVEEVKIFQKKISSLRFLDPACGSGNFLTESYLSLAKLEIEALKETIPQGEWFINGDSEVNIHQFYGIEINDFAVTVARTALWISEIQMKRALSEIINTSVEYLPLKSYATITEGNALRLDWNAVCPEGADYIIGNPPFAGRRYREKEQQEEISLFFNYKDIDYVACWYYKAAEYIQKRKTECAFVSTNSITQGEQVAALWKSLFLKFKININFAYRTFRWDSESNLKAHVHCVIIGFNSEKKDTKKIIYLNDSQVVEASKINGYLLDAPEVFIENRLKPLCDVPQMKNGNVPLDGDSLKIEEKDYEDFKDFKYVKRLMGGRELLHNEKRYVLWLVGVSPNEIKINKKVYERVLRCRENRLAMKDKATQKLADSPTTFRDTNNPENYIALPMVSSEKRRYIPMAYLHEDVIPTNQIQTIPGATLYHFGILTSNVHMAWMRVVCGRLEMRYRYSKDIVYNNFPWPEASPEHKQRIEKTAQGILDARAMYPDSSLADLYDEVLMPSELRRAHQENDKAVLSAYGLPPDISESGCVAELFKMYQALVQDLNNAEK